MRTTGTIAALILGALVAGTALAEDFSVTKVRLRRNSSGQGDNSVLRMQGFFVTSPPSDVFDAANGVTIRVQDVITTDLTIVFASADCVTVNTKTLCYAGGQKYSKLIVKALSGEPGVFSVNMKVRRQNLAGPFDGPVTVTVTENGSGIDRIGAVADCVLKVTGIACRAF